MLDFHGVMIHGLFIFLTRKLERSQATNALTESRRSPSVSGEGYVCWSHLSVREFGERGVFPNTKKYIKRTSALENVIFLPIAIS